MELNDKYWTDRYQNQQTAWDVGYASTPIKEYIDQLTNKDHSPGMPGIWHHIYRIPESPVRGGFTRCLLTRYG